MPRNKIYCIQFNGAWNCPSSWSTEFSMHIAPSGMSLVSSVGTISPNDVWCSYWRLTYLWNRPPPHTEWKPHLCYQHVLIHLGQLVALSMGSTLQQHFPLLLLHRNTHCHQRHQKPEHHQYSLCESWNFLSDNLNYKKIEAILRIAHMICSGCYSTYHI